MSSDATPAAPAAKSKKPLLLVVIIVAGIALGGGAGAFLAGPLLAGSPPPAAGQGAAGDSAGDGEGSADEDHGKEDGKAQAAPVVHLVDNVVLNPAQSGGSRFLLLSVAFAVKDDAAAKTLADRDPELRDVVIRYFGSRTVDELVDITQRDSMKVQLRGALGDRFGKGTVRDVFFPQFVVQ